MTDLSLARLCAFSYIRLPVDITAKMPVRLAHVCAMLMQSGFDACGRLDDAGLRLLRALADTLETAALLLVEYVDDAFGSGFAACVFEEKGGYIAVMRGSEKGGNCAGNIDWIDNFVAPLFGSRQYADVEKLLLPYKNGALLLTGHSKGGHNALYALAVSENALARATVFNAQGFGRGQLSAAQKMRLEARGINFVTKGDLVGRLLSHPEKRVAVCSCPYLSGGESGVEIAHRIGSLCFDGNGALVYCVGEQKRALKGLFLVIFCTILQRLKARFFRF